MNKKMFAFFLASVLILCAHMSSLKAATWCLGGTDCRYSSKQACLNRKAWLLNGNTAEPGVVKKLNCTTRGGGTSSGSSNAQTMGAILQGIQNISNLLAPKENPAVTAAETRRRRREKEERQRKLDAERRRRQREAQQKHDELEDAWDGIGDDSDDWYGDDASESESGDEWMEDPIPHKRKTYENVSSDCLQRLAAAKQAVDNATQAYQNESRDFVKQKYTNAGKAVVKESLGKGIKGTKLEAMKEAAEKVKAMDDEAKKRKAVGILCGKEAEEMVRLGNHKNYNECIDRNNRENDELLKKLLKETGERTEKAKGIMQRNTERLLKAIERYTKKAVECMGSGS